MAVRLLDGRFTQALLRLEFFNIRLEVRMDIDVVLRQIVVAFWLLLGRLIKLLVWLELFHIRLKIRLVIHDVLVLNIDIFIDGTYSFEERLLTRTRRSRRRWQRLRSDRL